MSKERIVKVHNKRLKYTLELRDKVSIIDGNSGTGKTTLINLIRDAHNRVGIHLECDYNCEVLTDKNWKEQLEYYTDSIIFIDTDFEDVNTVEFAKAVHKSNNYFVIVSREDLAHLIGNYYSITEEPDGTKLIKRNNSSLTKIEVIKAIIESIPEIIIDLVSM